MPYLNPLCRVLAHDTYMSSSLPKCAPTPYDEIKLAVNTYKTTVFLQYDNALQLTADAISDKVTEFRHALIELRGTLSEEDKIKYELERMRILATLNEIKNVKIVLTPM